MAFLQETPWRPLPLTTPIRSAPSLLIKTHFTASSYTVAVTDLCRVWTETLDRAGIIARAAANASTIDPAEDASQLQLLLEKVEGALRRPSGGDEAELVLTSRAESRSSGCSLRLGVVCELPSPLPELEWTCVLKQGSPVDFVNLFVMPLLSMVSMGSERIESLLDTIMEKDKVIDRMKDALEDNKVNIDTIIRAGRRRAMAPFDAKRWEDNTKNIPEKKGPEVVRDVFGSNSNAEAGPVRYFGQSAGDWWRGIEEEDENEVPQRSTKAIRKMESTPPFLIKQESMEERREKEESKAQAEAESETDDEFEVRKTPPPPPPPPLSKPTNHEQKTKMKNFEGSPVDDLDIPLPRKLNVGKIGGKKRAKSPTPPAPPPPPPLKAIAHGISDTKMADADEETEDDDLDAGVPTPPPPPKKIKDRKIHPSPALAPDANSDEEVISEVKSPAIERAIRKIGGCKSTSSPALPPVESEHSGTSSVTLAAQKPRVTVGGVKKSIGKISGRKKTGTEMGDASPMAKGGSSASPGAMARSSRSESTIPKTKYSSPEPEDEDEKADRKRRQLEKELEAKKKAPQKKRRKF